MREICQFIAKFLAAILVLCFGTVFVAAAGLFAVFAHARGASSRKVDKKDKLGELKLKNGEKIDLRKSNLEKLMKEGYHIVITANDMNLVENIHNNASPYSVMITKNPLPKSVDRTFVMDLPLNQETLSHIRYSPAFMQSLMDSVEESDIKDDMSQYNLEQQITAACILRDIELKGMSNVVLDWDPNELHNQMSLNGKPYDEMVQQWQLDAQKIQDIEISLDSLSGQLKIQSKVTEYGNPNPVDKTEYFQLSEQEFNEMATRFRKYGNSCGLTLESQKDLLMLVHPDYFATYQNYDGTPMYDSPIQSFLRNEPLVRYDRDRVARTIENTKKTANQNRLTSKKKQAHKNQPTPKHHF